MYGHRLEGRRASLLVCAAALAAVLAIALAGCGGGTSSTSASATSTSATSSASGSETAASPEGEPIKVMVQAIVEGARGSRADEPNPLNTAEAYADHINKEGGINGHPLEVITCDDKEEAQLSVDCAREAATSKVVAEVGGMSIFGQNVMPIYEQAKIPFFGPFCSAAPQEYTSKYSFPFSACAIGWTTGAIVGLAEQGCKNIAFTAIPVASIGFQEGLVNQAAKSQGVTSSVNTVVLPSLNPPDVTPNVAEATKGTDCIFTGSVNSIPQFQQWMTAFTQLGATQKQAFDSQFLEEEAIQPFEQAVQGSILVNSVSSVTEPQWTEFREALKENNVPNGNFAESQFTWASFVAFTKVAEGIKGPINNETFFEAANKSKLDMEGLIANLDFTKEFSGLGGEFPRMFNRSVAFEEIKGDEIVPVTKGRFVDLTNAMEGKQ